MFLLLLRGPYQILMQSIMVRIRHGLKQDSTIVASIIRTPYPYPFLRWRSCTKGPFPRGQFFTSYDSDGFRHHDVRYRTEPAKMKHAKAKTKAEGEHKRVSIGLQRAMVAAAQQEELIYVKDIFMYIANHNFDATQQVWFNIETM